MKNTFIAVTICENGKYYSYVIKHHNNNNLLSTLNIKNILNATIFDTFKKACETVERWNATYYANNEHLFLCGEDFLFKKYGTDKNCPRCNAQLLTSDLEQYDYLCLKCDENFYDCEV
jgi:hypothetical protein